MPDLHRWSRRVGVAWLVVVVTVAGPGVVAVSAQPTGPQGDAPTLPEPTADPDEVRREAERILQDGDFGREEPRETTDEGPEGDPGTSGGREQPREPARIPEAPTFGGMGAVAKALMWILVVGIVAVAAWLVWRAVRDRSRSKRTSTSEDEVLVEDRPADAIDRPSDEWLAMAAEAEAAGEWRDGLLYRYRSLVVALVDRGVIAAVPGRTVGEHRVDVAGEASDAAEPFDEAAWLFERAWYGERPTGAVERDRFVAMAAGVLAAPTTAAPTGTELVDAGVDAP